MLALESTGARMERLGASLLAGMPILALDETIERIEAVDAEAVGELAAELLAPERLSAAAIGPDEDALPRRDRAAACGARGDAVIRVGVAGAAGRMGIAACAAIEAPATWSWRAAPTRCSDAALAAILGGCDVVVDFTQPDAALENARRLPGRRRPRRDRDDGLRRRGARGRDRRQRVRRAELRDRRGADDALRRRGRAAHGRGRDHRAAPRPQARRPERHRRCARPS